MNVFEVKFKITAIYKFIKKLLQDKDLLNTSLNQGFKVLAGPLLLILIPLFISNEVQGYWFSFISISALSVLGDLGFTIIIMQFSAHEFAYLKIEKNIIVPIDTDKFIHLEKLASLLRFSLLWVLKIIIIVFPIILIVGFWFFNTADDQIEWQFPWILYTIGAALNFINYSILSLFEGCNHVSITQRIRFYNTLINYLIIFLLLIAGANLFALAISLLLSATITFLITFFKFKKIIYQLWKMSAEKYYNWFPEFWKFFKKYAISVASGFLVVQIFTPLSFKYYGSIEAGKVGLTMSLSTAIFSISNIWFIAIAPKINILTAQKNWTALNKLMLERLFLAICTYLLAFLIFWLVFIQVENTRFEEVTDRFLPILGITFLFLYWLLQLPIYTMALYLRAHKKEPYMMLSLIGAITILFLTILTVILLPVKFIFISLLATTLISYPFALSIFKSKKADWCN